MSGSWPSRASSADTPPGGRCPACASVDTTPYFVTGDYALRAVQGTFAYSRCISCLSVFADPSPDDDTLSAAYATEYGNYQPTRSLLVRLAEPIARREARRVVRAAASDLPLIDIGCGTGRFMERLAVSGWTGPITGVEYAASVAADTARRTGFAVTAGTAEEAPLDHAPYGAIVLRHVIEHVRDPRAVLARLTDALHPDGVLYVATPDSRAWAARVFRGGWWGYEVPRHLVVFSDSALRGALAAAGLRVISEHWAFSPDVWNSSLRLTLDRGRDLRWTRRLTSLANPLVSGPAFLVGGLEALVGHSTMYGVLARPGPASIA